MMFLREAGMVNRYPSVAKKARPMLGCLCQYLAMPIYTSRLLFSFSRVAGVCLAGLVLPVFVSNRVAAQASASLTNAPEVLLAQKTNSPSTPYLTPEEELKTFDLKPGYSLQLVVSDPIIKEPVVAVFDGNGR